MKLLRRRDTAAFNYTPDGARIYPAALCVSVNEIVHGIPNENPKILQSGDVVTIDLGVVHGGLITDTAITVGVGTISSEDKRLIEGTKESLYAGIKAARGGNRVGDIGAAVQEVGERLKLSIVEGLAGHGVGYKVHEDPFVPNTGVKGKGVKLILYGNCY
jgi:methionyl aminopeptidase